ncbi:D-glycero-D-manno-heptose 1,7-bisphosphate phosphatase [Actinokineospora iranica]|uniref:D-glycero-D-manno-heptose 1,7-bisphosphate phosphatase n=1 Tax=Actinokineospora iranica TaxID=1271860 RepID=A0A1G6VPN1_9PSEU|nr:D-glycero-D-manno-heptose 1,7-bisphosphate phosphatase [Actinokineospora iranica]
MPYFSVTCPCRKPAPGMLRQAAQDLDLALSESWMIGDSACDISAGRRAGTRTALIGSQSDAAVTPNVHRVTIADALYHVLDTLESTVTAGSRTARTGGYSSDSPS